MSEVTADPPVTPPKPSRQKAATPAPADKTEASVSTTIDADLKEKVRQRAEEEERTEAVLFRRAIRAYMKGWEPGQGDD